MGFCTFEKDTPFTCQSKVEVPVPVNVKLTGVPVKIPVGAVKSAVTASEQGGKQPGESSKLALAVCKAAIIRAVCPVVKAC